MARVTCRCGETIEAAGAPERVVCPRCKTKIRIRRPRTQPPPGAGPPEGDGYLRFPCPCGRRLKVRADSALEAGKCPDCGRVVPIPESARTAGGGPSHETRTEELDKRDLARLDRWAARHGVSPEAARQPAPTPPPAVAASAGAGAAAAEVDVDEPIDPPSDFRRESGLRVCSKCRKPLHMKAVVCRSCGAPAPAPPARRR